MEDLSYNSNGSSGKYGGNAQRRLMAMLFIAGMLTGIVVLVLYEVVSEGIGSTQKLHDRYHE
jgi:hypothetical protein